MTRRRFVATLGAVAAAAVAIDAFAIEPSRVAVTHHRLGAAFGWAPVTRAGSGDYVGGWYHKHAPRLYVSLGLGTSLIPARLGAIPEVACSTGA